MKIIIWGHKLHTHTSSYVHYGFYKAFSFMGHEVYWVDDNDDVSPINFDDCLFLTEGQVDKKIPINPTSRYILHNCDTVKYEGVKKKLNIQYFHNSITAKDIPDDQHPTFIAKGDLTKINDYTFFDGGTLFQPWATDLLPHEIDLKNAHNETENRECVWIGTYGGWGSIFQNHLQIDPFFDECRANNISILRIDPWAAPVSPEENQKLINRAFLAPSIQGEWQVKHGYTPCRLMKNISYGHIGITNNSAANYLFDGQLVFDENIQALFYKVLEKKNDPNMIGEIKALMQEVKTKHTYINRAEMILSLI